MNGPMDFGGHQGQPGFPQTAASDEAPRSRTSMGSAAASEAEEKQGSTWGQGDAVRRGGSVWHNGVEVVQVDRARLGVRRENGGPGGGRQLTTALSFKNEQQNQTRLSPSRRVRSDEPADPLTDTSHLIKKRLICSRPPKKEKKEKNFIYF